MSPRRPRPLPEREPDRLIPGQHYEQVEGIPMFRCEPYSCRLSPSACAHRFRVSEAFANMSPRAAAVLSPERIEARAKCSLCQGCETGAGYAGVKLGRSSTMLGMRVCARTGEGVTRLIGNRLSVSSYNRQREVIVGRNSKGTYPVEAIPLVRNLSIRYTVDGSEVRTLTLEYARDHAEAMLYILRTVPGSITFLPPAANDPLPMLEPVARRKAVAVAFDQVSA